MDIFAHGMLGGAISLANKKRGTKWWWGVFWGMFPDLAAFGPAFIFTIFNGGFGEGRHMFGAGASIAQYLYQYSHSLIISFLVIGLVWVFRKKIPIAMLAWPLHVLCDIPLHAIDFYPTPFLFPISDWRFSWGIRWSTPSIWIGTWVFVVVVYTTILTRIKYGTVKKT